MDATWVVTGAAGYLGSYVVEQLLGVGSSVVAVDDLSSGAMQHLRAHEGNPRFIFAKQDIRDQAALTTLFRRHRPRAVVHLAALHFIPWCEADPAKCISLNVHGTQCVLSAAREAEVERVWVASTGDVYAPDERPHHEVQSQIRPFNIYGISKWMGEQLVAHESRRRPDQRYIVGRLFNLYGPRETNPHILPEVLRQMRSNPGKPLRLGSLWPKRDLVPVAEAAKALIATVNAAPAGLTTVNIATGVAVSIQEVLDIIGELRGEKLLIETDPQKVRPVERGHLQADVSQLRSLIGWTPHADLRRALAELLAVDLPLASEPGR